MKLYFVPVANQITNLINSLGELGLGRVDVAVCFEIERADSAQAVTRLLDAVEQPFDLVYPPGPIDINLPECGYGALNFHLIDMLEIREHPVLDGPFSTLQTLHNEQPAAEPAGNAGHDRPDA